MSMVTVTGPALAGGRLRVPGDKSISHRCLIIPALARGTSTITGLLESQDVLATRAVLEAMGVTIERLGPGRYRVHGMGVAGLREPEAILDCRNSGTTARLLMGLAAGLPFVSVFTGDGSLVRRPMARVIAPLIAAGATALGRDRGRFLPMAIGPGALRPLDYTLPIASAQVKSALLLAALTIRGRSRIVEPVASRDHTERLLCRAGVHLAREGQALLLDGPAQPAPLDLSVPGDPSSAAFFVALAVCGHRAARNRGPVGPAICVDGVGLNPLRMGFYDVLRAMGAAVSWTVTDESGGEPAGVIEASPSDLVATRVEGALIPRLIDEVPLLAVVACRARGTTVILDAAELRTKESDRLAVMARNLTRMGAAVVETPDGLSIEGPCKLVGADVDSAGDHRVAMAMAVAGLMARGTTRIRDAQCVAISYPGFWKDLARLAPGAVRAPRLRGSMSQDGQPRTS